MLWTSNLDITASASVFFPLSIFPPFPSNNEKDIQRLCCHKWYESRESQHNNTNICMC